MLVDQELLAALDEIAVVGGDACRHLGREHVLCGLAEQIVAGGAVEFLGRAVDQHIGKPPRFLHLDGGRHVLDHSVQEVARAFERALGAGMLGHVLVGHHPTAAGHRLVGDRDEPAVDDLAGRARRLARGDGGEELARILLGIVGEEGAGRDPSGDELAHRRARPQRIRAQPVHLEIAFVPQQQPAGGVEHGETTAHIVERRVEQDVLLPERRLRPAAAEASDERHGGDRSRQDQEKEQNAIHVWSPPAKPSSNTGMTNTSGMTLRARQFVGRY